MRVLVLGGTGAMGVHLVNILAQNNVEAYITSRSTRKSYDNIHFIKGNAIELDFFNSLLQEKWDVIVDFMVYSSSLFKNRIQKILESTSQYVFISSARVYANSDLLITEDSSRLLDVINDEEFLKTDEYSLTKARQEDILKNTNLKNWTIIRPYITYDKNRLQLGVLEKEEWLYRALKGRTIVFSKDIISKFTTLTYGLDVSQSIFKILGNKEVLGETFHITTTESLTWNEVLNIYIKVLEDYLGYKPKILLKDLDTFLECFPVLYQVSYDRLYNRKFNNLKISNYSDVDEFISVKEGLKKCLEDFLKEQYFKDINWRNEAMKDKLTKEQASYSEIKGFKNKIKYILFRYLK